MSNLNNFKFGRVFEDDEVSFTLQNRYIIQPNQVFNQTEWVFQFDEDEPVVFGRQIETNEPTLTITLNNTSGAHITFTNPENNKQFKIYAREQQ